MPDTPRGSAALRTPLPRDVRWWLIGFVVLTVAAISTACLVSHRELVGLPVMLASAMTGGVYAGVRAGRASVWTYIAEAGDE